jgi:hypothetical protein
MFITSSCLSSFINTLLQILFQDDVGGLEIEDPNVPGRFLVTCSIVVQPKLLTMPLIACTSYSWLYYRQRWRSPYEMYSFSAFYIIGVLIYILVYS